MNLMIYFPGSPDTVNEILSPAEYNFTIFYAMPLPWQLKSKEKSIGLFSSAETRTLLKHFQVLWEADQSNKKKFNNNMQSHTDDRKRGYKGESPKSSKRARGNGNNSNNNRRNKTNDNENDSNKAKIPCKYHNGLHDWKDCFGNKSGKNFKPEFTLPEIGKWQPKQSMPRRNNNERNTNDAHHIDTDEAAKQSSNSDSPPRLSQEHSNHH
jgi:hypothetical protein